MQTHHNSGFTLIELLISLALIAALTTVAIPSMNEFIHNYRISSHVSILTTTLNFARSEAIKRGAPVAVCTSSTHTNCTAGNWGNGWIAFTDSISYRSVDGSDVILRKQEKLTNSTTLTVAGTTDYLRFEPTGFATAYCEECIGNNTAIAFNQINQREHAWVSDTLAALFAIGDAHASISSEAGNEHSQSSEHSVSNEHSLESVYNQGCEHSVNCASSETNTPTESTTTTTSSTSTTTNTVGGIIVATFTLCDSSTSGWKGKIVNVLHTGRISTGTITCP